MTISTSPILCELDPEVPGGWGPQSIVSNEVEVPAETATIPEVQHLHLIIEGWLGDELLTTHPCFIVSQSLYDAILVAELSGVASASITVTISEIFKQLQPDIQLPSFTRLMPKGTIVVDAVTRQYRDWSGHDVCISQAGGLVVTEKALSIIRTRPLMQCDITKLSGTLGT